MFRYFKENWHWLSIYFFCSYITIHMIYAIFNSEPNFFLLIYSLIGTVLMALFVEFAR